MFIFLLAALAVQVSETKTHPPAEGRTLLGPAGSIYTGPLTDDILSQLGLSNTFLSSSYRDANQGQTNIIPARNSGVHIVPPVSGGVTIIPARSAGVNYVEHGHQSTWNNIPDNNAGHSEGHTISGPAGSIYTGPLSNDIFKHFGVSNTIISARSGNAVIIPPRMGPVNIVPPVAGKVTIIPSRSAGVHYINPSEHHNENNINTRWNNDQSGNNINTRWNNNNIRTTTYAGPQNVPTWTSRININHGIHIKPPVTGKVNIIPPRSAGVNIVRHTAAWNNNPADESQYLPPKIPLRFSVNKIISPVAGQSETIPPSPTEVNIEEPSEHNDDSGWDINPASSSHYLPPLEQSRSSGVNIIPPVAGKVDIIPPHTLEENIDNTGWNQNPAIDSQPISLPLRFSSNIGHHSAGKIDVIPHRSSVNIVRPSVSNDNLQWNNNPASNLRPEIQSRPTGVNIIPPVAGRATIIPPRAAGVNYIGPGGLPGVAGWRNIIPDHSWYMNELAGHWNIMGPVAGDVRIIGPNVAENMNGIFDWNKNILANSKTTWTNGGGSISIGSHGAVIRGPQPSLSEFRGTPGKILTKRQISRRW